MLAATWLTIDTLVGTHHLSHLSLLHQTLESGQVGFPEVALWQILHVKGVAIPLWSAVYGKVLGTGQQFLVIAYPLTIIGHSLQTTYDSQSHLSCKERVLAIGLLTTTPAWVTENINVRCPERQTLVATDVS